MKVPFLDLHAHHEPLRAEASRAIEAVIPKDDSFPYTIRAVSEILEMNGSSSTRTSRL